jgi:hypothetical protein
MENTKELKTKKQCDIHVVVKRYFVTKNRWNNYEILSVGAYEKKLIFG